MSYLYRYKYDNVLYRYVEQKFKFSNFSFKIRIQIWFAYIQYSNLGAKYVHYFHLVKIGNTYDK